MKKCHTLLLLLEGPESHGTVSVTTPVGAEAWPCAMHPGVGCLRIVLNC